MSRQRALLWGEAMELSIPGTVRSPPHISTFSCSWFELVLTFGNGMILKVEVLVGACDPCTTGTQKTGIGRLPGGLQQVTRISAGREERQKAF